MVLFHSCLAGFICACVEDEKPSSATDSEQPAAPESTPPAATPAAANSSHAHSGSQRRKQAVSGANPKKEKPQRTTHTPAHMVEKPEDSPTPIVTKVRDSGTRSQVDQS